MINKYYKGNIMERFMSEREQQEFDGRYESFKIVRAGQDVIKKVEELKRPDLRWLINKIKK